MQSMLEDSQQLKKEMEDFDPELIKVSWRQRRALESRRKILRLGKTVGTLLSRKVAIDAPWFESIPVALL